MPRPKKFTAKTLDRAVNAYFDGISRTVTVTEQVDSGQTDKWGHTIYIPHPVLTDSGAPVTVRRFAVPPTVGGLCKALGIHRSTWADYCDHAAYPEFQDITESAREVFRDYLETELLEREGKNLQGVIFSLQNNYGQSERRTVELGQRAAAAASAGARERDELLRLLEAECLDGGNHDDG